MIEFSQSWCSKEKSIRNYAIFRRIIAGKYYPSTKGRTLKTNKVLLFATFIMRNTQLHVTSSRRRLSDLLRRRCGCIRCLSKVSQEHLSEPLRFGQPVLPDHLVWTQQVATGYAAHFIKSLKNCAILLQLLPEESAEHTSIPEVLQHLWPAV